MASYLCSNSCSIKHLYARMVIPVSDLIFVAYSILAFYSISNCYPFAIGMESFIKDNIAADLGKNQEAFIKVSLLGFVNFMERQQELDQENSMVDLYTATAHDYSKMGTIVNMKETITTKPEQIHSFICFLDKSQVKF